MIAHLALTALSDRSEANPSSHLLPGPVCLDVDVCVQNWFPHKMVVRLVAVAFMSAQTSLVIYHGCLSEREKHARSTWNGNQTAPVKNRTQDLLAYLQIEL